MKALKKTLQACFVSGCMLAGSSTANAAVEYLKNGSFETGDVTGWIYSFGGGSYVTDVSAQEGRYSISTDAESPDFISQTFADTPGETLIISGWVQPDVHASTNVRFSFNDETLFFLSPVPPPAWTQYTVTAIATGKDTFTVSFTNTLPNLFLLDNFSVSAVPEPSTVLLMGAGMLGAGFIKRRKAERTA